MSLLGTVSLFVGDAFIAGAWQGLVLVGLVALVLRMVPRLGAAGRFGVWGLTFLACGVVPFVRFSGRAAGSGGVRVGAGWGFAVAGCWGLLMVVRLGRLVVQGIQLRRIWNEAVSLEATEEISELLAGMPRRPVLCVSEAVDAPSVIGFWAPKLLIPEWQIGSLSEAEMRQVVLHECEHLRRGDDWVNLAQKVGLALFPLNPALLWADRRLSLERELACDVGVVTRTRAPFDYAECLTRLAEQRMGRRTLGLALSAWGRESELGRRVHRLLRPVGSMGRGWMRLSVGVLAVVVTGGSLELARVPRLISFADERTGSSVARSLPAELGPVAGVARMMPVMYREPVGVAASGKRARVARRREVRKQVVPSWPLVRTVRVSFPERQAGVVLTSARVRPAGIGVPPAGRDVFRLMDAVSTDVPASYAAVPFANGWLILQL